MSTGPMNPDLSAASSLPMELTAADMRRHCYKGEAIPFSPTLDSTMGYAGHWWVFDGANAWLRVTDPGLNAIYEAHNRRSIALQEQLRSVLHG